MVLIRELERWQNSSMQYLKMIPVLLAISLQACSTSQLKPESLPQNSGHRPCLIIGETCFYDLGKKGFLGIGKREAISAPLCGGKGFEGSYVLNKDTLTKLATRLQN